MSVNILQYQTFPFFHSPFHHLMAGFIRCSMVFTLRHEDNHRARTNLHMCPGTPLWWHTRLTSCWETDPIATLRPGAEKSSSLPKAPLLQPTEDRQLPRDHNFPARMHAVAGQVAKRLSITYSAAKYAVELLVQGWSPPSLAL